VLDTIDADGLVDRAAQAGTVLASGLRTLAGRHPLVADVRGRGLAAGVELRREDGAPARTETAKTVLRAFELGLVLYYVGVGSNVLEFTPPLTIGDDEIRHGVGLLDQALADVEAGRVSDEAVAGFAGW
jgi:4-aminobutyrate aminotransferase